jgi:GT2 family glycosyltransferase
MRVAVIIPTTRGRKDLLPRLLEHLENQTSPPGEVIVSAPDESHVAPYAPQNYALRYLYGRQGLCAQRNRALDDAEKTYDVLTFFDDDFFPADNYVRGVVEAFEAHSDWVVLSGKVVADGATSEGYSLEEGLRLLREAEARAAGTSLVVNDHRGAYGCNMSIRAAAIDSLRFDERLPLYGWQEDIDFSSQVGRRGRVVSTNTLLGVHLGQKTGKVSGVRFGYSQVANPVYLIRKKTMGRLFGWRLILRNVAANILRSVKPEPYIDRRGRLRGNMLAIRHCLSGRIEPEHILDI